MHHKAGSNLFTRASVAMFLQFIIALSYILYVSRKITEFED